MDLYKEMLIKLLENEKIEIILPDLNFNISDVLESECYKALQKIKNILEDDALEDDECFVKIEEIVCLFEQLGSNCGNRHDFG